MGKWKFGCKTGDNVLVGKQLPQVPQAWPICFPLDKAALLRDRAYAIALLQACYIPSRTGALDDVQGMLKL